MGSLWRSEAAVACKSGMRPAAGNITVAQEFRAFAGRQLEDLGQTRRQLARRSPLVRLELAHGVHRTTAPVRELDLAQVEVTAQAPQPLTVIIERDGRYPPMVRLLEQLDDARTALAAGRKIGA